MDKALFWHRRDLRIEDNAGLFKALKSGCKVQPIFIFDKNILDHLPTDDQRVIFIHQYVEKLKSEYIKLGADLLVFYGFPLKVLPKVAKELDIKVVYTNRDYEPYARNRDAEMKQILDEMGIPFHGAKDHVIFEKNEVLKDDGKPYTVFTPYSRKWKSKLNSFFLKPYPVLNFTNQLVQSNSISLVPSLEEMGFKTEQKASFPADSVEDALIQHYALKRDIPSLNATSKLSVHLRFGTISIRKLAQQALINSETFLNELIWRDFYSMILFHFPRTVNTAFKPIYDGVEWEKNDAHFSAWCQGKTGYPLVDAGMRELNQTGFMHNRVRMVVASFLTKHLLIDWRLGEAYFAQKLLDFDLASNIGGWQWAAGCGSDAAPYFRVFNPSAQQEKFDKELKYIKKWIPEIGTEAYPAPIIEHKFARERVLDRFKMALNA